MSLLHKDITNLILKGFYNVYNQLGYGFLEKVYENAMVIELRQLGLFVEKQKAIKVYYGGDLVGDYFADLMVNEKVIIELKAAASLAPEHEAQLLNYLKGTDKEVGLLLNFGTEPQKARKIFENQNK